MLFNSRSHLIGKHAFLSPSNYHWVNYDDDKLTRVFYRNLAAIQGTELHELANNLIRLGVKLPEVEKTLNMYVNDAIGYNMKPEVILYYTDNCYGSADACGFRANKLRIHDYKSGLITASEMQLKIYAALFCLEYRFKPFEIEMELRIYQNDEARLYIPDPDEIFHIMDRIVTFDKHINELKREAQ